MPAANTGRLNNSKKLVISTLQANRGTLCIGIPGARILKIVVIKFIEPNMLLNPETCNEKMLDQRTRQAFLLAMIKGGSEFDKYD